MYIEYVILLLIVDLIEGTSTSGKPFKSCGRVGDSPIPGAGLYADNEVNFAHDALHQNTGNDCLLALNNCLLYSFDKQSTTSSVCFSCFDTVIKYSE